MSASNKATWSSYIIVNSCILNFRNFSTHSTHHFRVTCSQPGSHMFLSLPNLWCVLNADTSWEHLTSLVRTTWFCYSYTSFHVHPSLIVQSILNMMSLRFSWSNLQQESQVCRFIVADVFVRCRFGFISPVVLDDTPKMDLRGGYSRLLENSQFSFMCFDHFLVLFWNSVVYVVGMVSGYVRRISIYKYCTFFYDAGLISLAAGGTKGLWPQDKYPDRPTCP